MPTRETGGVPENLRDKKGVFDAGEVWLEALLEFEDELHEHVEPPGTDRLRFQDGRLLGCLKKRIEASGMDERVGMFGCYEFATTSPRCVGYGEARRKHGEEMEARRLASAGKFCAGMPKRFAVAPEAIFLEELRSRVRSVAAWMECQESFSLWLVLRDFHSGWRGEWRERGRAVAAVYLSRLHKKPEWVARIRTGHEGKGWSDVEWRNILKQAAGLVGKRFDCEEWEKWLWWAYPVARRYSWNTRELQDAACARGYAQVCEMYETNFRRRMLTLGLPLSGKKKARGSVPPLREFVVSMVLPDERTMWGEAGGLLFVTEKKR